jgi:hypothetical protein
MTLGALGGKDKPLTRAELLELAETSPTTTLSMLGRALGVSEPGVREMRRRGQLEQMGIRVLPCGSKFRIPVIDILRAVGLDQDVGTAGPAPPADPAAITQLRRPSPKGHHHDDSPAA